MKKVFFISAMLLFTNVVMSQDFFDSPIHRTNLSHVEPYEWSTVDDNDHIVIMRGNKHPIHKYSLELIDWLGAEPGQDEYYVVLNTGVPIKVSIFEARSEMWIVVDYNVEYNDQ